MAEFTHRQDRPGPQIHYGEVRFPDERELGTGTYSVAVEPAALTGDTPVAAVVMNRPVFQLALEVNPQSREAVVTFGRADGAEPVSQSAYRLPDAAPPAGPAVFVVEFDQWTVRRVTLDQRELAPVAQRTN